jgi:ABC-2 type transport system ATP-binding protein
VIELHQVDKMFGQRLAVDSLSLAVPSGEIYGLLGHNGAGKSTAIGMMLGQVWPTRGEIKICGFDITTRRNQALQSVGAIFEGPAFYDYLSGFRNLEILSSYTAPTQRARLQEVIEWVGLTGREHSKVRTYSHGMRARLALAQALLPKPQLLILDEPSDGLDPEGIHDMRHTILRLHRELGLTILLSSHFLSEVEQLCTRIAVLSQGRMVYEGTLSSVRHQQQWVRLRTGDFARATQILREAGMITDSRDEQFIALQPGIGTEHVVRHLVEAGLPLYEIAHHEESLEEFYLQLMKLQTPSEPQSARPYVSSTSA